MNGADGFRVYGFSSTFMTGRVTCCNWVASCSACALVTTTASLVSSPRSLKSRPAATRLPLTLLNRPANFRSSPPSVLVDEPCGAVPADAGAVNSAAKSQYSAGTNTMRLRSRSTITRVATDCTRPALSRGITFFHNTGDTS